MKKSVENLKEILEADGKINENDGCYHIAVTLDGTWQNRYGFNSLHGVIFLMSLLTGEINDYVSEVKYVSNVSQESLATRILCCIAIGIPLLRSLVQSALPNPPSQWKRM